MKQRCDETQLQLGGSATYTVVVYDINLRWQIGDPPSAHITMEFQFNNAHKDQWTDPEIWRKILPHLQVDGTPSTKNNGSSTSHGSAAFELDVCQGQSSHRQQLMEEGYALVDEQFTPDLTLVEKLRKGIEVLHELQLPATFILMFDETWELAKLSRRHVLDKATASSHGFHFDILAWHVTKGGFSPHRDRQPEDPSSTFEKEDAKFVTHWIALSDATTQNSCLYVIPKSHDPGYMLGDTDDDDPLRRALPDKQAFQHIRALPRKPGQSVLFTHRIIHWGSARDPCTTESPRVAISFVSADPTYEKPYINPDSFTFDESKSSGTQPSFHVRLLLVCAQLLIYYQRFDLPHDTIKACYDYCKAHEQELDESYRHKVFCEFVNAMKEPSLSKSCPPTRANEERGDSDDEEAVLEEMLDATTGGYGEFDDDFDGISNDQKLRDDCDDEEADDDDDEDDEYGGNGFFGTLQVESSKEPSQKRVRRGP
jgi:ectoine hydroxylase-related dioxygenase (phytanoyl-CoA dioxygenase family)